VLGLIEDGSAVALVDLSALVVRGEQTLAARSAQELEQRVERKLADVPLVVSAATGH
jgi:hypothetical protein